MSARCRSLYHDALRAWVRGNRSDFQRLGDLLALLTRTRDIDPDDEAQLRLAYDLGGAR